MERAHLEYRLQKTQKPRADLVNQAPAKVERSSSGIEAVVAAAERAQGREPMGALSGWAADFSLLGLTTGGVAAALMSVLGAGQPLDWSLVAATAALIGATACIAGLVAGMTLRGLQRAGGSPVMGIFWTSVAANFTGSMLTIMASSSGLGLVEQAAGVILGRATGLSLMVLVSIPLLAVLRWREQRTWPWMLMFGVIAGVGVWLVS